MKRIYLFNTILIMVLLLIYFFEYRASNQHVPLKVGILFSQSGTLAESEKPVMRAALLAINEINQQGGINGRPIIPVIYDAESNLEKYSFLAKKMILDDHVKMIIGCWTSASRKVVKPIVEQYNNLLIYPTQSEGVEDSGNIVYLGATPNQQASPAAFWMFEHVGKRVYLVGSDYIYPYVSSEILSHRIKQQDGKILGTAYIPLGSMDVDAVVNDIIQKKPDIVFNMINGSTNIAFFNRLYALTTEKGLPRPPVMSFSLSTSAIMSIGTKKMIGDFATWSYFLEEDNPSNHKFLNAYQKEYGSIDKINDPAVTAYSGVYLWAQAAKQAPSIEANVVRDFMLNQSIASPMGVLYVDPSSGYAWRKVEIGRINNNGKYDIIWQSATPIEPVVYPDFKTKTEWNIFEYQFYKNRNNTW